MEYSLAALGFKSFHMFCRVIQKESDWCPDRNGQGAEATLPASLLNSDGNLRSMAFMNISKIKPKSIA